MAKVKSVKFYNFTDLPGNTASGFLAKFYDENGKLILIDLQNCISKSATYSESSDYVITSDGCYDIRNNLNINSFHVGNFNNVIGIPQIGYCWVPHTYKANSDSWIKIEFKFPKYLSRIEILHCYSHCTGFNTCSYDVEYVNGIIESRDYISNGQLSPINDSLMISCTFDQATLDTLFDSLEFSKSKQIYNSEIGLIETLDTNNFRNISKDSVKKLKVLYSKPENTLLSCIVSFDQGQTWKTFNNSNWLEVSDTSPENIILDCMSIEMLNKLDKNKLIAGGFTGDLDFKIAMKTNSEDVTPSISKIYIEYK